MTESHSADGKTPQEHRWDIHARVISIGFIGYRRDVTHCPGSHDALDAMESLIISRGTQLRTAETRVLRHRSAERKYH